MLSPMRIGFRRYSVGARWYDVLSGERLVYRIGRVVGIRRLGIRAGDTVLDVGCGTGLNLPLLARRVGPDGRVIGADLSPDMLRMARNRVDAAGWGNVTLIEADATTVDWRAAIADALGEPAGGVTAPTARSGDRPTPEVTTIDAAVATYSLSVTDEPDTAWHNLRTALRPGARVCVVDMADPRGLAALFRPLARLACALGGADISAHPWRNLERDGVDIEHLTARGDHIHIVTGTVGAQ